MLYKKASFGGEPDQAERSLMEMAYAVLVDRARPLMRDPFRLGFEVVYTNEDSSKMVGIFIFRVGKNIFYIPVFYRNGKVRGLHTIFDCRRKKVKPLTTDWCERLVAQALHKEGRPVERSLKNQYGQGHTFSSRNRSNLYGTELSGGTIKVASAKEVLGDEPFNWIDALRPSNADYIPGAWLQKVAAAGGEPAILGLRNACAQNEDFLHSLAVLTEDVPSFFAGMPLQKHATASKKSTVVELVPTSHSDFTALAKSMSEEELTETTRRGWAVNDTRDLDKKASTLAQLPDGEIVSAPGKYNVLFDDGEVRSCYALVYTPGRYPLKPIKEDVYPYPDAAYLSDLPNTKYMLVTEDGKVLESGKSRIFKVKGQGCPIPMCDLEGKTEMQAGNAYVVAHKDSGVLLGFFSCCKTSVVDDLTHYEGALYSYFPHRIANPNGKPLHKDKLCYSTRSKVSLPEKGLLGQDVVFFKMQLAATEKSDDCHNELCGDCSGYSESNLHLTFIPACPVDPLQFAPAWTSKLIGDKEPAGLYTVRQDKLSRGYSIKFDRIHPVALDTGPLKKNASETIRIRSSKKVGRYETADAAAAALMLHSGLSWEDSTSLVKQAGRTTLVKRAGLVEQPGLPSWTTGFDGTHNVALEEVEKYVVPVDSPEYVPEDILHSRLGDREGLGDAPKLLVATPSELFEFSRANDVKALFEHSTIRQLVKTYDVGHIVDSYLPELEAALDRMGRILILLHWKPGDVAKIYGVEDTVTLEDKLLSGFLNLGEIFLELDTKIRGGSYEEE